MDESDTAWRDTDFALVRSDATASLSDDISFRSMGKWRELVVGARIPDPKLEYCTATNTGTYCSSNCCFAACRRASRFDPPPPTEKPIGVNISDHSPPQSEQKLNYLKLHSRKSAPYKILLTDHS